MRGAPILPDKRSHRGPHPEDAALFAPAVLPLLVEAAADMSWLLTRGYSGVGALKLVGDRYQLSARQRTAVARSACSDQDLARRRAHQVGPEAIGGQLLWIDGYNVLTTVEAALAGGVLLACRDGAMRDMASMHGSYRKVTETLAALELLGETAALLGIAACVWYLDRPVSNSGRLKTVMAALASERGWNWSIELVANPDPVLSQTDQIAATADSAILDRCRAWFNFGRETVARRVPEASVIAL
jgi:hypothetical protein